MKVKPLYQRDLPGHRRSRPSLDLRDCRSAVVGKSEVQILCLTAIGTSYRGPCPVTSSKPEGNETTERIEGPFEVGLTDTQSHERIDATMTGVSTINNTPEFLCA